MKIQVGSYYRTREGLKAKAVANERSLLVIHYRDDGGTFVTFNLLDGRYHESGDHKYDLVSEWNDYDPNYQKEVLSLLGAMQSGKPFRFMDSTYRPWMTMENGVLEFADGDEFIPVPVTIDHLSARYELKPEPKKVEVTADMIDDFRAGWADDDAVDEFVVFLKEELGLG